MVFGENLADLAQFHFRADGNDLFFRDIPYLHCHELLCAFLEIRQLLQGGGIDKQRLHIRKEAQDTPSERKPIKFLSPSVTGTPLIFFSVIRCRASRIEVSSETV